MRTHAKATFIGLALAILAPDAEALAQGLTLPCDAFVKNDDATWSALRSVPIHGVGESFTVREGSVLRPGAAIRGVDLAGILDDQCPATPEPATAPTAAQPIVPTPRVTLGSFVNQSGVVEAQRLTCAELADISADEAQMLLAWYSGWYAGTAKKRGLNPSRTLKGIHAVMDYCKANRVKKTVQVMELMLK